MARATNGTDQLLNSASALNLTAYNKLAISFWAWIDAHTGVRSIITTLHLANAGAFGLDTFSNGASGVIQIRGNVGLCGADFTMPSASAWHHYAANLDFTQLGAGSAEIVGLWIDGSAVTLTPSDTNDNTASFATRTLYLMSQEAASSFTPGRIAEMAIWGGQQFSGADVTALSAGTKLPDNGTLSVGAATHYWKIGGTTSPEPATLGGINLTVTGATQAEHPPAVAHSLGTIRSILAPRVPVAD